MAGRPTKYKPEMCDRVIELMKEGASKTEVAADLDITWDTLARWQEENPLFSEAIKRGERLSQAWWERMGRQNLVDPYQGDKFNATLWYMNMKNRFGWRDKSEVENTGTTTVKLVAIDAGPNPYKKD